jgi:nitroreductase
MDVYHAVASKRDWRRYDRERAIEPPLRERILDAGRLAGSARNRQPWRFLLVESPAVLDRLAATVYVPENLLSAALVVAIATPAGRAAFDVGRVAQNMMLVAWDAGVVSCVNSFPEPDRARDVLELEDDLMPVVALSFAYPARAADPGATTADEWSHAAWRKPLAEIVERR